MLNIRSRYLNSLLLAFSLVLASFYMVTQPIMENVDRNHTSDSLNYPKYEVGETDLDRVDYRLEQFPNHGFESWINPHDPEGLPTTRTSEIYAWYESSPVSEGTKSLGVQARAIDIDHPAEMRVVQSPWSYLINPTNLTLAFDWWIDNLASTGEIDYFEVEVVIDFRTIYYYVGSQPSRTNMSNSVYFMIDGQDQQWNQFDRNITSDYKGAFGGATPTQLKSFKLYLRSYSNEYARIYLDDLNLVNGTTVWIGGSKNNGNFETGTWWVINGADPGDISRSPVRVDGNWSLNATVISNGNTSKSQFYTTMNKRLTELNQDQFSFWWRIDEWVNPSADTYGYLAIPCANATDEFTLYISLADGSATEPSRGGPGDENLIAHGFNLTSTWNFFNISLWEIFSPILGTELLVEEITFYMYSIEPNSRLTILFDEMSFVSSGLSDMSYEDQLAVGSPIHVWSDGIDESSDFTVTDFAYTGSKAANLTLVDSSEYWGYHSNLNQPFNSNTELILDLNFFIESFNETAEQNLWLEIVLDDNNGFALVIANASVFTEMSEFVILQENNIVGSWVNLQLDLVHLYESVNNFSPDTVLDQINLVGQAYTMGSNLTVFFDDFYLYEDPTPELSNVNQSPLNPEIGDSIQISATAVDATLDVVTVHYRVDTGIWNNLSMSQTTEDTYQVNIPSQAWNSTVEYYVNATDAYGKSTFALNGSVNYSFTVDEYVDPIIIFEDPTNESTVSGVLEVNLSVTDVGSGIASVNISINGTSVLNATAPPSNVTWDTTQVLNGLFVIQVTASDKAGNSAQKVLVVTVDNPNPPDLFGSVIVLSALMGGVVVVVVVFLRRRS